MPYVVEYRHEVGDGPRTAEAETASKTLKLCEHLAESEAEVLIIRLDGVETSLGEVKNEAGREAVNANRQ